MLEKFVISLVHASPNGKIEGKKRLQKICHLMKEFGSKVEAEFVIHRYGPYSYDLADTTDFLVLTGQLDEYEEPTGLFGTYQTVFCLSKEDREFEELDNKSKAILNTLSNYSTVELEIASTIKYFQSHGLHLDDAIRETISMKPSKAVKPILAKAEKVLGSLTQS